MDMLKQFGQLEQLQIDLKLVAVLKLYHNYSIYFIKKQSNSLVGLFLISEESTKS